jgi:putative proteasome-type protease
MTYCVAVDTSDGLVFCSDSRTNAGPDIIASYSKMHVFDLSDDRLIVLLSAGNLATTQAVIARIEEDLEQADADSLRTCDKMVDVAKYVAQVSRGEQEEASEAAGTTGINTSASFITGGQIRGGDPAIFLIYSAGNFISTSEETPYLQIGESKYGKPILDRIVGPDTSLEDAARCALVSMDSTIKANATVGPPIEILVYEANSFNADHRIKLTDDDPYLQLMRRRWTAAIAEAFSSLPLFEWEGGATSLRAISDDIKLK